MSSRLVLWLVPVQVVLESSVAIRRDLVGVGRIFGIQFMTEFPSVGDTIVIGVNTRLARVDFGEAPNGFFRARQNSFAIFILSDQTGVDSVTFVDPISITVQPLRITDGGEQDIL